MSEILTTIHVFKNGKTEIIEGSEARGEGLVPDAPKGTFDRMLEFNPLFTFGIPPKLVGLSGWQNRNQDPLRGGAYKIPANSKIYYARQSKRYYLKGYSPLGFWPAGKEREFIFMKLPQVPSPDPTIDTRPQIDGSVVERV